MKHGRIITDEAQVIEQMRIDAVQAASSQPLIETLHALTQATKEQLQ